jgi:hypothetical protein
MNPGSRIRTVLLGAALALAVCGLALASAAMGAGANPVINDCLTHPGGLTGNYTVAELQHALQVMSAETKEYTDCSDVIHRAILVAIGKVKGTAPTKSDSGSFLPTPVIVVLVLLLLAAVTFGAIAIRRRRGGGPGRDAAPGG